MAGLIQSPAQTHPSEIADLDADDICEAPRRREFKPARCEHGAFDENDTQDR